MGLTPSVIAALDVIRERLETRMPDVTVERARRAPVNLEDDDLPRVVVRMGELSEEIGDAVGTSLHRWTALVEGYVSHDTGEDDPDVGLELAIAELHARCHEALVGVELAYGIEGESIVCEGRGMIPEAPLVSEAADAVGGFTWTIAFDIRAAIGAGPFTA